MVKPNGLNLQITFAEPYKISQTSENLDYLKLTLDFSDFEPA